jgi:hypothetical protein
MGRYIKQRTEIRKQISDFLNSASGLAERRVLKPYPSGPAAAGKSGSKSKGGIWHSASLFVNPYHGTGDSGQKQIIRTE